MDQESAGRLVRQAWIDGVKQFYPETPKSSYIAPWEEISEWERSIVIEIYQQVRAILLAGEPSTRLTPEQGGRLVRLIWIGQVYKHIRDPKPAYVCNWEELAEWEQSTDIGMFKAISQTVLAL